MSAIAADSPTAPAAALLDVGAVAALLNCSPRHVYRQADAGRLPAPVRIGAGAFIGTNAVLLAGAEIGAAARVADHRGGRHSSAGPELSFPASPRTAPWISSSPERPP